LKLIKNQPATRWGEAFPVGNGHMGAMVYGSLPENKIELTENTFFSGEKSDSDNRSGANQAFYRMRELASRGEYDKVHKEAEDFIGIRSNYGTNLPVGHLLVDYGFKPEEAIGYERSLNIRNGMVTSSFWKDSFKYQEELFLSHPDQILMDHIKLEGKDNVKISFHPSNEYGKVYYEDSTLSFTCYAYETLHCDRPCGAMAVGHAAIVTDGSCSADGDGIVITEATNIKLYLRFLTDFKSTLASDENRLLQEVISHVQKCIEKEYSRLKQRHQRDISRYMDRVSFQLEGSDEYVNQIPVLFQYGRYLLLSSSREDSKLPAHLQGIWNDNVACRIGWTCDMHLDINTQMNYWPSEAVNLSESSKPLFQWIKDDLMPSGTLTARESYGLSGWVGELVSNAWGFAAPYWASPIAPCPTGGIWVMMQMWEHFLYNRDLRFLKGEFLPVLESAVEFFEQYLFLDKSTGYYTSGPSISPENSFLYQGKPFQISNGCTYEVLMIRELFLVYQESCNLLGLNHELYRRICEKTPLLQPYRITSQGTIAEWNHDLEEADPQHRHTSHLLGLYPFTQINPEDTPELCEAAKKTLQAKLNPIQNWEDTGWARSMLMLYEARLYHGDEAYEHMKSMLKNLLEPNHMVYHPPTRGAGAFDHVYELDGNTGLTTCIAEVLLQSQKGVIRLLPALPGQWKTGEISGLRARGNITVDMKWDHGKLIYARLTSKKNVTCIVEYSGERWEIDLKKGLPHLLEV
jgi:alpha-L-fucosidase 2